MSTFVQDGAEGTNGVGVVAMDGTARRSSQAATSRILGKPLRMNAVFTSARCVNA
jgi:hypothetical protein